MASEEKLFFVSLSLRLPTKRNRTSALARLTLQSISSGKNWILPLGRLGQAVVSRFAPITKLSPSFISFPETGSYKLETFSTSLCATRDWQLLPSLRSKLVLFLQIKRNSSRIRLGSPDFPHMTPESRKERGTGMLMGHPPSQQLKPFHQPS